MPEKLPPMFGGKTLEEMTSGSGISISIEPSKIKETMGRFKDHFLEIFFGSYNYSGIYQGITPDGAHVIQPTIHPNGEDYFNQALPPSKRFTWRNEPIFIYDHVTGFRPASRVALEACASGFDKVADQGKYLDQISYAQGDKTAC